MRSRASYIIRVAAASAGLLLSATLGYADMLGTAASVRSNNSLIVDIQVTTSGSAAHLLVTYEALGVDPLVSRVTPVSTTGSTTIAIGRLRANKTYTYTVDAFDRYGGPAGTAGGTFTTGPLPPALLSDTYTLKGRMTTPLVILDHTETVAGAGTFRGYVALGLHSSDAPQIVWYYNNAPSNASGVLQSDTVAAIARERHGNFLLADGGSGPAPLAADSFYREIAADTTLVAESPAVCSVTPPANSPSPPGWIWGQGNDVHEQLLPGADGVLGTILHLGKIAKDPFFDAGLSPQGMRVQLGTAIRRWNPAAGTDDIVWDPFNFLDPLKDRTDAAGSDPVINSNQRSVVPCAGTSLQIEEWMHANSLQVAPAGVILMSVRHLDTVIAIAPEFDRIGWRIGRFGSDFAFPNPRDRFYHEHFVRMIDNGDLLLFDNGDGRPVAEGGQYSRALEIALDWGSMTAAKVWEYRHQVSASGGAPLYKYADKVGSAQRLENGNTIVLFGADIDPATLRANTPQIFTLVEADDSPEASALAVLDIQIGTGNSQVYRALPVNTLFGEAPGKAH